jgi:hypothetical protein
MKRSIVVVFFGVLLLAYIFGASVNRDTYDESNLSAAELISTFDINFPKVRSTPRLVIWGGGELGKTVFAQISQDDDAPMLLCEQLEKATSASGFSKNAQIDSDRLGRVDDALCAFTRSKGNARQAAWITATQITFHEE